MHKVVRKVVDARHERVERHVRLLAEVLEVGLLRERLGHTTLLLLGASLSAARRRGHYAERLLGVGTTLHADRWLPREPAPRLTRPADCGKSPSPICVEPLLRLSSQP